MLCNCVIEKKKKLSPEFAHLYLMKKEKVIAFMCSASTPFEIELKTVTPSFASMDNWSITQYQSFKRSRF